MTVQQLIDKLQAIEDKSREVILAGDPEGNWFAPLADHSLGGYLKPELSNSSEFGTPVVVLWP